MAHEKEVESWKLLPLPSVTSTSTVGGEPYYSEPKYIKSLPFPSTHYDSFATEDMRLQWHLTRTSNAAKGYGWDFPPRNTQLSQGSSDGEFSKPRGDVGTIKPPLGDSIPFSSGSQDGRCARDSSSSSSSSACYMCGEAQHFARKCSLGANSTA